MAAWGFDQVGFQDWMDRNLYPHEQGEQASVRDEPLTDETNEGRNAREFAELDKKNRVLGYPSEYLVYLGK